MLSKILHKVKKSHKSDNDTIILELEDAEEKCFAKIAENSKLSDKANIQKQQLSLLKKKAKEAKKVSA